MVEPIRLALIGLKGINDWHYLPGMRQVEGALLVAGVDLQEEARLKFQAKTGLPAYANMAQLAACERVEGVIIGTPNPAHLANIMEAAELGWHISVTKPLANTVADCQTAIRLCRERNLQLQVGHEYRFRPAAAAAIALVRQGRLGQVTLATAHMGSLAGLGKLTAPGMWRSQAANVPGGCLNMLGVHMFDLLNAVFGHPVAVTAQLRRLATQAELEDTAAVIVEYEGGALGVVTSSYASVTGEAIRIYGTAANAIILDDTLTVESMNQEQKKERATPSCGAAADSAKAIIEEFCAAIRAGAALHTTGEAGLLSVAQNEAAIRSCREGGRRVTLAELLEAQA